MRSRSNSPLSKRAKLGSSPKPTNDLTQPTENEDPEMTEEDLEHQCSICLQHIVNRTVVPICSHEFCFDCLIMWSEQSRRCPLCSQSIGEYLIHTIRSRYDFRKHYLAPLRSSPKASQQSTGAQPSITTRRYMTSRERERARRLREEQEETDKLQRSIENRRLLYQNDLYAKHVASNAYTRYRPYPTPSQFASSAELTSRTTTFLRRELQIWNDLDVEFLTTFIISLMKSIDIRSESAVKLLAEFLDIDTPYVEGGRHVNAEHFAHEVYCYVRSPFRDLFVYDTVVQYDTPPSAPSSLQAQQRRRESSRPHSRSRPRLRQPMPLSPNDRYRSMSWSPSGRQYPSSRERFDDMINSHNSRRGKERDRRGDSVSTESADDHSSDNGREPLFMGDDGDFRGTKATNKGKEPASGEPCIKDTNAISGSSSKLTVSQNSDTLNGREIHRSTKPNDGSSKQTRPPRNRTLLDSVRSHLTLGSDVRPAGDKTLPEGVSQKAHIHCRESSGVPSLLARMSDVAQGLELVPRCASLTLAQHISGEFPRFSPASSVETKMILPEITTRARLVENNHDATSKSAAGQSQAMDLLASQSKSRKATSPSGSTIYGATKSGCPDAPPVPQTPTIRNMSSHSLHVSENGDAIHHDRLQVSVSRSSANLPNQLIPRNLPHVSPTPSMENTSINSNNSIQSGIVSSPPAAAGARKVLLSKLENEKNQALRRAPLTSGASPNTSTVPESALQEAEFQLQSARALSPADQTDPQAMEAKLRRRARLQVRLTAEKRKRNV